MFIKLIFGILAIYLWLGIIFSILILKKFKNSNIYQIYSNHILIFTLNWPIMIVIIISARMHTRAMIKRAEKKVIAFDNLVALSRQLYKDAKIKYLNIIYDKSLDIEDRLDALVELGDIEYLNKNFYNFEERIHYFVDGDTIYIKDEDRDDI